MFGLDRHSDLVSCGRERDARSFRFFKARDSTKCSEPFGTRGEISCWQRVDRHFPPISGRGPYSLHTFFPAGWMEELGIGDGDVSWASELGRAQVTDVLTALRRVSPDLENRSIRRGSIQTLADARTPEDAGTPVAFQWSYLGGHSTAVYRHSKENHQDDSSGGQRLDPRLSRKASATGIRSLRSLVTSTNDGDSSSGWKHLRLTFACCHVPRRPRRTASHVEGCRCRHRHGYCSTRH